MKAEGTGRLYVADGGKKVRILELKNESIHVNGNDIFAHDQSIKSNIKMLKSVAGMMSGGLFQVTLTGSGFVAITTHGDPLLLLVTPENPVFTDPNATVAWSGNLSPELKTNISIKSIIGRGSGEEFQMKFSGSGWVYGVGIHDTYRAIAFPKIRLDQGSINLSNWSRLFYCERIKTLTTGIIRYVHIIFTCRKV